MLIKGEEGAGGAELLEGQKKKREEEVEMGKQGRILVFWVTLRTKIQPV